MRRRADLHPRDRAMYVAEAKRLTLAGARKMMATATARAEEAGIAISVAIVDAGGHVIKSRVPARPTFNRTQKVDR
jgi:hypothetical protein